MGLNPLRQTMVATLLFVLPLHPAANAWAVDKPCPDLISRLKSALDSPSKPKNIQALEREQTLAWNDYSQALAKLHGQQSSVDLAGQIHDAYSAQVRFCNAHNLLVQQGRAKYEMVPMQEKYYGEDLGKSLEQRGSLTAKFPGMAKWKINYLNPQEASSLKVHQENGKLVFPEGRNLDGLHHAEYVMNSSGTVFVLDRRNPKFDIRNDYRHSSLSGGSPVAASGTISFDEQGRITAISRRSGHYTPDQRQLKQFIGRLMEMGVDLSHVKIMDDVAP